MRSCHVIFHGVQSAAAKCATAKEIAVFLSFHLLWGCGWVAVVGVVIWAEAAGVACHAHMGAGGCFFLVIS